MKNFTRIPNELLEVLAFSNLTAGELKIILLIIRDTYGFRRESAKQKVSDISKRTNLHRITCQKYLKKMVEDGLIERVKSDEGCYHSLHSDLKECSLEATGGVAHRLHECSLEATGGVAHRLQECSLETTPIHYYIRKKDIKKIFKETHKEREQQTHKTQNVTAPKGEVSEKINSEFEHFWSKYPTARRSNKTQCLKLFVRYRNQGISFERIMDGLDAYLEKIHFESIEERYVKKSSNWLFEECWEEDYTPKRKMSKQEEIDRQIIESLNNVDLSNVGVWGV